MLRFKVCARHTNYLQFRFCTYRRFDWVGYNRFRPTLEKKSDVQQILHGHHLVILSEADILNEN